MAFDVGRFFTGFVFCVNIIMGTGGLALPLAYAKAGTVLGSALMLFAAFAACVTICWHFEGQIRAYDINRAFRLRMIAVVSKGAISLQTAREGQDTFEGDINDGDELSGDDEADAIQAATASRVNFVARSERTAETPLRLSPRKKTRSSEAFPEDDATAARQLLGDDRVTVHVGSVSEAVSKCGPGGFELVSIAEEGEQLPPFDYDTDLDPNDYLEVGNTLQLFWGRYAVMLWQGTLLFYVIGTLWCYTVVLAESALVGIPLAGVTHYHECDPFAKHGGMPGRCVEARYMYVTIFILILAVLIMRDWKLMPLLQKVFTTLMYVILVIVMTTCIVGMNQKPYCDPRNKDEQAACFAAHANSTKPYTQSLPAADFENFATLFGFGIFAMICHTGSTFMIRRMPSPSLTKVVFRVTYVIVWTVYTLLALIVALYLGTDANALVTVNWAFYSEWANGKSVEKGVGSFVLFFPIFSVTAAYILTLRSCSDAAEFLLPLQWRQRFCKLFDREYVPFNEPERFSVWPLQFFLRIGLWFCGTVLAYASTNFSDALKITSLCGFVVMFIVPILIQVGSRRTMIKLGFNPTTPFDDIFSGYWASAMMFGICIVATAYYCATSLASIF